MCKSIYFIRARRGREYEDFGRDAGGPDIHWTVDQCRAWLRTNTVNGEIDATDGGAPFICEIVEWA